MGIHKVVIDKETFAKLKAGRMWDVQRKNRYKVGDKIVYLDQESNRKLNRVIMDLSVGDLIDKEATILTLGSCTRTSKQNHYYWSQMKRLEETIPGEERTAVDWHETLKEQILAIKGIYLGGKEIPFSTAWLSMDQFNWYLRRANDWVFRRWGIAFEDSAIWKYQQWKKDEIV